MAVITGTFTRSSYNAISHMRILAGLGPTLGVTVQGPNDPVILLDEIQELKIGKNRENYVFHAKISEAAVKELGLREGMPVEITLNEKYNPAHGAKVAQARTQMHPEWVSGF